MIKENITIKVQIYKYKRVKKYKKSKKVLIQKYKNCKAIKYICIHT